MSLATDLISTAQDLLNTFGQNVTFTNSSDTSYNSATATKSSSDTEYSGDIYVSTFRASEIGAPLGSTTIKKDDLNILASSMDRVPEEGDTVVIDSVTYRIMDVEVTNVSGTDVLYKLTARK